MTLTTASLKNPVAVFVATLLALLFGFLSLNRLPVQLTPEVEKPEISISTNWRAAAPAEVESEIVEPQEKVLRGLPGMTKITSSAKRGQGTVSIEFTIGMDMQRALLEVLNRLNRVPFYPEDAEEPIISSVGGGSRAIAWFIFKPVEGNTREIASYQEFLEEVVQSRFERVPGVSLSEVRGGRNKEVRITFDPYRAASLGIELPKIMHLAGSGKDVSAGESDVGKRRYSVRFTGKYHIDDLKNMVLEWRDGHPVRLADLATVEVQREDLAGFVIQNGEASMAVNAHREVGVNVLQVMQGLREATDELREGALQRAGLSMEQVYDETIYIDRSIALVGNNLIIGMLLAIGVLWWFLRQFRATLLVAVAIPASIITTFIILDGTGRSINVISLAGLAFAVGMVLDAAIVVLENIVRLRENGETPEEASRLGTLQVWGALFASTITTVAIFLPVVFMKEEAGQLFADLALAIAAAICFSLIAAVTILPTAAQQWLAHRKMHDPHTLWWDRITRGVMHLTDSSKKRWSWIAGLMISCLLLAGLLMPKADYLPEGNRNLVFAFILPPPGSNIETVRKEIGLKVAADMQPYIDGEKQPQVMNYFFVVRGSGAFMGARTLDPTRTKELVPIMNRIFGQFPDTFAFARQSSLFGGLGGGNNVEIDIQGSNLESILAAAQAGFTETQKVLKVRPRPFPSLDLSNPELALAPNERRIAEVGWNRSDLGGVVRALGDGLYVGDYFDGEQRLDVIMRAQEWATPEDLAALPVSTPQAGVVSLGDLLSVTRTAGPDEIRRVDRRRTITLQVKPPEGMDLETTIKVLKEKVEPAIWEHLPEDGDIRYSGAAEKLTVARDSMMGSFLLAIVILYLLISALFRSFKDSLLVMATIPLATVGGVIMLSLLSLGGQHLDLLTMIGFIILLGLVVNNAILLVYQARNAENQGLSRRDSVEQAVRLRLRPILMSTLTSIFGMLPLLVWPGAGSELYRGLAGVIVGGMAVSTVFTLILLPSLLRLGEAETVSKKSASKKARIEKKYA
ncbi:MAG: efflux RND transporter permease subunit [Gammaproteobacteria bacterium]|nr:efflux RND transporter permease subunit [Gammaproteobacteria bacterium]MDH5728727.1 efflux RND transporter permease subunit [Gammaproteobacteria bacterium]